MVRWPERPTEVANLLNPAFCALILRESVRGFADDAPSGMPFPLVFLILPLTLHKRTREAFPNSIATKMHPWIENNQQAQVGFAQRCSAIVSHTKEALLFANANDLIEFTSDARLVIKRPRLTRPAWPGDSEPTSCLDSARFLGRWLSRAGDTATVFAMWGVRP
jgi:hypothetical protein